MHNTLIKPTAYSSLPLETLKTVFGYSEFRPPQKEIIDCVLENKSALVLMPTGGGKSLCFQIPALVREGTCVVISPLIALMQDQVQTLKEYGVAAEALNSSASSGEQYQIQTRLLRGELKLLYISPERLLTEETLELLSRVNINLFAIDEAHCVSQWGHDFRPEYLKLNVIQERFPSVTRIALTATADELTRKDILAKLEMESANVFISGFDRANINYQVVLKQSPTKQLLEFIEANHSAQVGTGDSGIVYCLSRKRVEEVAAFLVSKGYDALPYHAGLDQSVRSANQNRFINEEGVIVVATIAFGMGIDKPNVRFVAHLDLPKTIESYYQETGRAGRDSLPSNAWMAYGLQDAIILREMILKSETSAERKIIEQRRLNALLGYCETTACRRTALLKYFGEEHPGHCGNCDNCITPVPSWDGTHEAKQAISCIYRTGQKFGVGHLVDVLCGNATDQVKRFGHDKVSTFGIGAQREEKEWRSIFRQLIAASILEVDVGGYGSVMLTDKCKAVLNGDLSVSFRSDIKKPKSSKKELQRKGKSGTVWNENDSAKDKSLFELLRIHRLKLAKAQNVPPYVIFHDTTLKEIAIRKPKNIEEMSSISGVGVSKLARYGESFLGIINSSVE